MRALPYAALLLLLLAPALSGADIWQWTDAEGVVRYTPHPDRVPSGSRGSLVKVEPGMPPAVAAQPSAEPAPAASVIDVDADPFNAPQAARSVEVTEVPEPAWANPQPAEPEPDAATAASAAVASAAVPQAPVTPEPPAQASPPPVSSPPVEASPPPVSSPSTGAAPEVAAAPPPAPATDAPGPTPAISEPDDAAAEAGTSAVAAPIAVAAAPTPVAPTTAVGVDPWSAVAAAGAAAAAVPPAPPPPAPLTAEQRSRRDELEQLISQDEETLKRLLSDTELDAVAFEQSAELREIAQRLPALQAELRALEDGPTAPEAVEEP